VAYHVQDPEAMSDGVAEVCVDLTGGQRRWCYFPPPAAPASSGATIEGTSVRFHYGMPHLIIVAELSEDLIGRALREIDSQGDLLACTRPIHAGVDTDTPE
jgi:hypothetical protein